MDKINPDKPQFVQEVWYITEKEKNEAIKSRKLFGEFYNTDTYFKIINRIDNTFIEGNIGH